MRGCMTLLVFGRMKEQDYMRVHDPPRLGQNKGAGLGEGAWPPSSRAE